MSLRAHQSKNEMVPTFCCSLFFWIEYNMCEPSSPTLCDESRGALTKNTSCLSVQLYSLLPFCPPWKQTFFSKQRILPSKTKHSIQGIGSHTKNPTYNDSNEFSLSRVCCFKKHYEESVLWWWRSTGICDVQPNQSL